MDLKPGYVFVASFVLSGLTVGAALAPLLNSNPITVGFWASIGGGIVGGAMTLVAGWLAWTAAQRQIAAQQQILELAADEHRKRVIRLFVATIAEAEKVYSDTNFAIRSLSGVEWGAYTKTWEKQPISTDGFSQVMNDPDYWRIDYDLAVSIRVALHDAQRFNARAVTSGINTQDAALFLEELGAHARRISDQAHAAMKPMIVRRHEARPEEPPAR